MRPFLAFLSGEQDAALRGEKCSGGLFRGRPLRGGDVCMLLLL